MDCDKHFIESSPQTLLCVKCYKPSGGLRQNADPVLLVHGLMNSSELFDIPGVEDLSFVKTLVNQGYAVYTYDQRGSGESSTPDWDFGLKENALVDLPAVIRFCLAHSGGKSIVLGGYSLGGIIIYLYYSHLIQAKEDPEGASLSQVSRIFTIASPGVFHDREGRWEHLFERGERMVRTAGAFIDRAQFVHGQIYIYSPLLSKLVSVSLVRLCVKIAEKALAGAMLIKSLPIPSFLYARSDFDARTFLSLVRSKVLDRTSTRIFQELFHFAAQNGSISISDGGVSISLPEDFQHWSKIPVLLISSNKDELIRASEVESAHERISGSVYLNVDNEFGQGCGHAGYVFKRGLTELVRERIAQFLRGANHDLS